MSMRPEYRKCPICKKTYSYNPSVGKFSCPYCADKHPAQGVEAIIDIGVPGRIDAPGRKGIPGKNH